MKKYRFSGQGVYEIKVKSHLDEQWSSWFEDLAITTGYSEDGTPITTSTYQQGMVSSIDTVNGQSELTVNGTQIPLSSVLSISP